MKPVDIYTDGGCTPNPGIGGWGAVLIYGDHVHKLSGGEADTTNNQMELTAAIQGLKALNEPCQVNLYSDSQYLIMTMTKYWKRKKNHDLWDQLDEAAARHKIEWHWVRGHNGNEWNEMAHVLADAAMRQVEIGE